MSDWMTKLVAKNPKWTPPQDAAGVVAALDRLTAEVPLGLYSADDMPRHAGMVLTAHVALKGAEIGSTLALVGRACVAVVKKTAARDLARAAGRGAFVGGGLAAAAMMVRAHNLDAAGIDDRAYRILHNAKTEIWDVPACVTAAALGGAGYLVGVFHTRRPLRGALAGAGLGLAAVTLFFFGGVGAGRLRRKMGQSA